MEFGALGSGIEACEDGYHTYEDFRSHHYVDAVVNGVKTVGDVVDTVTEALTGDWL